MDLIATGLTKSFGRKLALNGVSLRAGPGVTALLGPNGSGKTTLLRLLATVITPDAGLLAWNGRSYSLTARSLRQTLGYLPQRLELPGHMTPRVLLRYMAHLKQTQPADELERLGLLDLADQPVERLSSGQMRRAGVAQALLGNPHLLILDEPTAGLDPEERDRVLAQVRRPVPGRTVILSTHVPAEAEAVADEVIVLRQGRVAFAGPVSDLVDTARGQVWEVTVPATHVEPLLTGLTVSRVANRGATTNLRVIGTEPPGLPASPAEPSLEDAYLLLVESI